MNKNQLINYLRDQYQKMMLSKAETAQELGIPPATLDRLRTAGRIDGKMIGTKIQFRLDEVARVLFEGTSLKLKEK